MEGDLDWLASGKQLIIEHTHAFVATFLVTTLVFSKVLCSPSAPKKSGDKISNLWFSDDVRKAHTERLFITMSPCWMAMFAAIIGTGAYEGFTRWHYLEVCGSMALVYPLVPLLLGVESDLPFFQRYWVKDNVWIIILSYVGNFHWTIYFYEMLGAAYTFDAHRFNDVPVSMFFATHAYFCFYHSLMNITIRRVHRTKFYRQSLPYVRLAVDIVTIAVLAYFTAFMETKTIEGFPYWEFKNRDRALTVGSFMYMLYFIVSFPAHLALEPSHTLSQTCWSVLGSAMLSTILLEWWRLAIGKI